MMKLFITTPTTGFIFTFLQENLNTNAAVVVSSALFGLSHYPVFGGNALLEYLNGIRARIYKLITKYILIILFHHHHNFLLHTASPGVFFAFSFYYSGYNLAVPIAVHVVYDFANIFAAWWSASIDMKR